MNSKTESVHVDEKNGSMVQLIRIIFKNIKQAGGLMRRKRTYALPFILAAALAVGSIAGCSQSAGGRCRTGRKLNSSDRDNSSADRGEH